jgi:hypothetical protein
MQRSTAARAWRGLLGAGALGLAGLALAPRAAAFPIPCPVDTGGAVCELTVGGSYLRVDASSNGNGDLLVFDWLVDGVPHLFYETFRLATLPGLQDISLVLEGAAVDDEEDLILAQVRDAASTLRMIATFRLADVADGSIVHELVTLQSLAGTQSARLYAITDFDLNDGLIDGSIAASSDGSVITQVDGNTSARISVLGGPPDGFTVAPCCALNAIASGNFYFDLGGNTTVAGPDDFQSGLSWDSTLGAGQIFAVQIKKRIAIPEPSHALGAGAGVLAVLALVRRRARA